MVNNANNGGRKVETPTELWDQFDNIGYDKAGAIMLMIRALIGDELWTKGLVNYLYGQEYGTANWAQLLSYWDQVLETEEIPDFEGMTITDIMESYFRQMGYPVIKVTSHDANSVSVKTSRFLSTNDSKLQL